MRLPFMAGVRRAHIAALARRDAAADADGAAPQRIAPVRDRVWSLSQTPLFAELSQDTVDALTGRLQPIDVTPKEEAMLESQPGRMYIVAAGELKLLSHSSDGRNLLQAVVGLGGLFGELTDNGAAHDRPALVVRALERTRLLRIDKDEFMALLSTHPAFALGVLQEFDGQRRRLQRRVRSLIFKDVEARVVETVLEMARSYAEVCIHGMAMDVRLTQQDLADLVGASREQVNRSLRGLQRRAYLRREGRVLCISSMPRLERLARAYA